MTAIAFSVLVLIGLLSIWSNMVMRFRVSYRSVPGNRLSWWMRSSEDVTSRYQELFPNSWLPRISEYAFWCVVAAAATILAALLWKAT